jgi:hypothetical protein
MATISSIIVIQSSIRMMISRQSYFRALASIVKWQGMVRAFIKRKRRRLTILALRRRRVKVYMTTYSEALSGFVNAAVESVNDIIDSNKMKTSMAIFLQKTVRMRQQKRKYQTTRQACMRIQKYLRACLANAYLSFSVSYMYDVCSHGSGAEMENLLSFFEPSPAAVYMPFSCHNIRQYLSIRNRRLNFATPLHIALCSGNMSVVEVLQPGPADVLAIDKHDNNAAHFAVLHPSIEAFVYLSDCLELKYDVALLHKCGVLMGQAHLLVLLTSLQTSRALQDGKMKGQTDMQQKSSDGHVLKQGWLQKVSVFCDLSLSLSLSLSLMSSHNPILQIFFNA